MSHFRPHPVLLCVLNNTFSWGGGWGCLFCVFGCLIVSFHWTYCINSLFITVNAVLCSMGALLPANKVNLVLSYLILYLNKICVNQRVNYRGVCELSWSFVNREYSYWINTNLYIVLSKYIAYIRVVLCFSANNTYWMRWIFDTTLYHEYVPAFTPWQGNQSKVSI